MEFKLKYERSNDVAFGVFVEHSDMQSWIEVASSLENASLTFYPIPGLTANSVVGALIVSTARIVDLPEAHLGITRLGDNFYLPCTTSLWPKMNNTLLKEYFKTPHFFHPIYGLIELQELSNWSAYLNLHTVDSSVQKPKDSFNRPEKLGRYYIREVDPNDAITSLIKESVPESKRLESTPLSNWEKVKLRLLRATLGGKKRREKTDTTPVQSTEGQTTNTAPIQAKKASWWKRKKEALREELESLEDRNKNEIDKLIKMLNEDPDEALKYALPIDRSSESRGPDVGFTMTKRWSNGRSLVSGSSLGGSVNLKEQKTQELRDKYNRMAQKYIDDGKFEKASFVYMELLNDPYRAANTLKQGERYEAAAAIFLKKCNNKSQAAYCYEVGHFYSKAIDLYAEMEQFHRVGTLERKIGNEDKAIQAFKTNHDQLIASGSYLQAGKVAEEDIYDIDLARDNFKTGWQKSQDRRVCLDAYFDTYEDEKLRLKQIDIYHQQEHYGQAAHHFIDVLKIHYTKAVENKEEIERMTYETIAKVSKNDPSITSHLKTFNKGDLVKKDIMRYIHAPK